jgi:hypothetical protein
MARESEGGRLSAMLGLLSVFADVAILLVLAAALASPRMSQLARPVIATFAFACAWVITAASDAMHAQRWTIFVGAAVIVVSIVVITTTLHLWTQGDDDGDGGPGHRGSHGGGGPRSRQPDAPHHGGGDDDASWWPEFERELALYGLAPEPVADCLGDRIEVAAQRVVAFDLDDPASGARRRHPERVAGPLHDERGHAHPVQLGLTAHRGTSR